jgi:hypothetical protein
MKVDVLKLLEWAEANEVNKENLIKFVNELQNKKSKYEIIEIDGKPHKKCRYLGEYFPLEDFVPNKNYTRKGIGIWTAARRQLEKLQVMTKFDEKKAKEYEELIETLKHYNDTEYYQNGKLVKAIEEAKKI